MPQPARSALLQGTLDMLFLRTLQWGAQRGYGISKTIRAQSSDVLQVETGSLYPALQRLEKKKWVTSGWKQTESNQCAKYYRLTAAGRKQLASEQARWQQLVDAIASVMNPRQKSYEPAGTRSRGRDSERSVHGGADRAPRVRQHNADPRIRT